MAFQFENLAKNVLDACQQSFGESITFLPHDGDPIPDMSGIFDSNYLGIDPGTTAIVQGYPPSVSITRRALDAAGISRDPDEDDKVTIRGDTYSVKEIEPDGRGDFKLVLHKDP